MFDEMPKHLKQFIMYGEGTTCKFKMAKNRLPSNLFETICVMLNRNGGNIFLGIKDDGQLVGIDSESIRLLRKKFADKFYMEDNLRINVRDVISRELRSNLLIHREFSNPYPAKLIITKDGIYTENANKSRMIGYMDLSNYTPYPKNPKIAKVFKEIGLVDELGSGIRKVVKYTKACGEELPTFKDEDIFKTFVPYDRESDEIEEVNNISNEQLRDLIYEFIKNNNGCTRRNINNYVYSILNEEIDLMSKRIKTNLAILGRKDLIINVGSKTKPKWKIKKYIHLFSL